MDKQSDPVNHPTHYAGYTATIECIDISRHLNFQLGNAFKYIWRAGRKGGAESTVEDLRKALWYIEDFMKNPGGAARSETALGIYYTIQFPAMGHREHILNKLLLSGRELEIARMEIYEWIEETKS